MTKLVFRDLRFIDSKDSVKVIFLRYFHFFIDKADLDRIGRHIIGEDFINFDADHNTTIKFYSLVDKGLHNLTNNVTGKKTIYIYKGAGIPLIGNSSFGIVDRGSNLIEIKPVCGCNLSCIYCSVDEMKRTADFLVEKDYLVEELKKVVEIKKHDVEIHIGCHGEPLLYAPLVELVKDVSSIPKVKRISMDTNGMLLTQKIIDELIDAGMTRFNLSLNALEPGLAKKIAGGGFSVSHAKKIAEYISKKPVKLTIAPVWMKGINDGEVDKLIEFGKSLGADIGIQNFLKYQFGKNPAKEVAMPKFYTALKELEKKHGVKLVLSAEDFGIKPDTPLPKPFKKGDVLQAVILFEGRLPGEMLAVAKDRSISVFDCNKKPGARNKIKITRSKHNIFSGVCV